MLVQPGLATDDKMHCEGFTVLVLQVFINDHMIRSVYSSSTVPQLRPVITVSPALHSTKSLGEYLMLKCCTSDPLPNIKWVRVDAPMSSKVAGVNSTRLFVPDLQITDMGKYVCVAFNLKGVAISQVAQIHPSGGFLF